MQLIHAYDAKRRCKSNAMRRQNPLGPHDVWGHSPVKYIEIEVFDRHGNISPSIFNSFSVLEVTLLL